MKVSKIKQILIDKGYYSYDHAISTRCITDIIKAYEKSKLIKKKVVKKNSDYYDRNERLNKRKVK